MHAVKHTGLNISQIVFYEAGEIQITDDINLAIDSPGLVMAHTDGPSIKKITVADPSRKLNSVHLKVTSRVNGSRSNFKSVWNAEKGYSDIYIDLPQAEYAGKSVVIEM